MCLTASACQTHFHLRQGDLLFHVASDGNAITDVTPGMIDHVAIYLGGDTVVEAIGRGVVITHLDTLLRREPGYYQAGRVKGIDRRRSVVNALLYLGRPYDHLYLPNDEAIYCSELVQLAFVDRQSKPVFQPVPMSFHDSTGIVTPYWQQFYASHGLSVPEGEPGTNPAELSRRPQVLLLRKIATE